ncbi:MAG: hypothetical protein DMG79_18120 [Acidobacteria bacterium]|nr:MAG: hypothetical protein DMG79_18120 [Acidobacteriota bacterium]
MGRWEFCASSNIVEQAIPIKQSETFNLVNKGRMDFLSFVFVRVFLCAVVFGDFLLGRSTRKE